MTRPPDDTANRTERPSVTARRSVRRFGITATIASAIQLARQASALGDFRTVRHFERVAALAPRYQPGKRLRTRTQTTA